MVESPVIEGQFQTGSELMLWRPGVDRTRLRWRAMLSHLVPLPATYAGLGAGVIALGAQAFPGKIGWLLIFIGLLVVGAGVVSVWVTYQCIDFDHQHDPGKPCFVDKVPGRYFYRRHDFNDLPPSMVYSVGKILAGVREVYASPTADWLDLQQLRELHQLAWDSLCVLDQTRTLRSVVDAPPGDSVSENLIRARSHLAAVDDAVDRVLTCLHQVVLLVQAWEQKLVDIEARERLRVEVDNVPRDTIAAICRSAGSLPESIFAYVTAARDIAMAGPFEWERAQP